MKTRIFFVLCLTVSFFLNYSSSEKLNSSVDMIEILAKGLAKAVSDEESKEVVKDIVVALNKYGDDRKTLTKQMWTLLEKRKVDVGPNKRLIPVEVVRLLKAKMSIEEKKSILARVLEVISQVPEVRPESYSMAGSKVQLSWFPPSKENYSIDFDRHVKGKNESLVETKTIGKENPRSLKVISEWVPPPLPTSFKNPNDSSVKSFKKVQANRKSQLMRWVPPPKIRAFYFLHFSKKE